MKGSSNVWSGLMGAMLLAGQAVPHEIRPAYLQVNEPVPNHFDILWKQPSMGNVTLHLVPKFSNGLLNVPPIEEYATNSYVIRRWKENLSRDAFDGATVSVEGLEHTLTGALVIISFANGQQIQALLKPSHSALVIHLNGTGKTAVPAYLTLGVEHILTGVDHLCFVLCLVLLVCGRSMLLKTITAFTIAHSITLATAALGYARISPPLIESLVALSIVFVAVELARSLKGRQGLTARYPWLVAFTFGLLHGFAFAGSLADIGLPPHNIPVALLLFNCGVEIGQLMFVGALLALIEVLRLPWAAPANSGRWLVPYAVGTVASYWMFERIALFVHF